MRIRAVVEAADAKNTFHQSLPGHAEERVVL
jgi:hypothetical protein